MEPVDPAARDSPPADPDLWTDQQWIDWLNATDAEPRVLEAGAPSTVSGRIVHSPGGQLLGQTMMGLARAIYGRRDERPVIVAGANSDPESDRALEVHLDPDDPTLSFVRMRNGRPVHGAGGST